MLLDLLGVRKALEDIALHLKRIADLYERQSGYVAPGQDPTGRDASTVFYTSDAEHARMEAERLAYQIRTGRQLADWEEVPAATDGSGKEWQ